MVSTENITKAPALTAVGALVLTNLGSQLSAEGLPQNAGGWLILVIKLAVAVMTIVGKS